jgi:hypothetical protein
MTTEEILNLWHEEADVVFVDQTPHPWPNAEDGNRINRRILTLIEALREYEKAVEKYADENFDWGYDHGATGDYNKCDFGEAAQEAKEKVRKILGVE